MLPTIDASGAIRKCEIETRKSKSGGNYEVLILTVNTGDKIELNSFSPIDKGSLTLIKVLSKANTPK